MKVKVTQTDINKGLEGSCRYCPIARALSRTGKVNPQVGASFIHVGEYGLERRSYLVSKDVAKFIRRFDRGDVVVPTTFDLKLSKQQFYAR